ncbi:ACP S-malonyltransferase [Sphingomonas sp. M1-B02]|uniref:ACP S-malonyltransferase n=1 Tax=Sphingomonas sp. M1-B02 TaxID=3114300 RepID=UPI0022407E51|nr:acyltransferase domain-containing protein [Sphingomonas sp. S6-11]UZK66305.1 acyltransferase domain-containing protein [Sphingomonas sp. S6-11]
MRALLCSGQGLITRGMFDRLAANDESAPVLDAAAKLLGQDPRDVLAGTSEGALIADRTSQILCIARALAAASALRPQAPTMVAGYSVGEMAAWSIAGFWTADQALRLTAHRAELMDVADAGTGGLGYVRGLDETILERLLERHACAIAIRNPGGLYIIGGLRPDVAACCADAVESGAVAARPIAVGVASHTPRLAAAVAPFEQALWDEPVCAGDGAKLLIGAACATTIRAADRAAISGLAHQLASTVDWNALLTALAERGARRVLELGPGDALANMVHANWPGIDVRALDDFTTVAGARQWFDAA